MKLTNIRRRVLRAIIKNGECLPTAREIAETAGEHRRASDWAIGHLRAMERDGLVERIGYAASNALTWRVTDLGLSALSDSKGAGQGEKP